MKANTQEALFRIGLLTIGLFALTALLSGCTFEPGHKVIIELEPQCVPDMEVQGKTASVQNQFSDVSVVCSYQDVSIAAALPITLEAVALSITSEAVQVAKDWGSIDLAGQAISGGLNTGYG